MSERINVTTTARGFALVEFEDRYGASCSLQKSSLATEDAVWFGVDDAEPKILASDAITAGIDTKGQRTGWVDYPVPREVLLTTRMHLTRQQVADLLPILRRFVETGELTDG